MTSLRAGRDGNGFTLIELLIVIAIIAILSVVVVLALNPAELLKQARDANRLSDLSTLNSAIGLYATDQSGAPTFSLGTSTTAYISVSDASSSACSDLGLPAVTGAYGCTSSTALRAIGGTGWIPVNLSKISSGAPIGSLSIDPTDQTSTGLYYSYATNGTQYELNATLESQKYKTQFGANPAVPGFPEVLGSGPSLTISPLFNPSGLIAYWNFDETTGTIAYDSSGDGDNATFGCLGSGCSLPIRVAGRVGPGAIYENPTGSQGSYALANSSPVNDPAIASSSVTISLWINPAPTQAAGGWFIRNGDQSDENYGFNLGTASSGFYSVTLQEYDGSFLAAGTTNYPVPANTWSYLTLIFTQGQGAQVYVNGVFQQSISLPYISAVSATQLDIGSGHAASPQTFDGYLDDLRIYNRALSPAEIWALYTSQK